MERIDETTVRQEAEQAWRADAALRTEFGNDFASYLAYAKADARGGIRRVNAAVQSVDPLTAARLAKVARETKGVGYGAA